MFGVICAVNPRPEAWNEFLDHAPSLHAQLPAIEGIIANSIAPVPDKDRSGSITRPGNGLYPRWWHDLASAGANVRRLSGRSRIACVVRACGMVARAETPQYPPPTNLPR